MKLARPRGNDVKINIQPHPYVKGGPKGQNKSIIIYDADTDEVYDFIKESFEAALEDDVEDEVEAEDEE